METAATALEFAVSPDRKHVMFVTTVLEQEVPCTITRAALERHFWVSSGVFDARLLRAFADGRKRITAEAVNGGQNPTPDGGVDQEPETGLIFRAASSWLVRGTMCGLGCVGRSPKGECRRTRRGAIQEG
jgi:hypothetical protein